MVILQISFAMFLLILAGWIARRWGYFSTEATSGVSRFVVDFCLPALVLVHLLRTVDAAALQERWYVFVFGAANVLVGQFAAWLLAPCFCPREQRPTFLFVVAINNWIFLGLPIAEALYGDEGVQTVLLANASGLVMLWTFGVWTLRGGKTDGETLRHILLNPALIATVAGIALALLAPQAKAWLKADSATAPLGVVAGKTVLQALDLVGSLTIPFALVVTGAQLGGLKTSSHRLSRALVGVLLARLALAPAIFVALAWVAMALGAHFRAVPLHVGGIIAAMPTAMGCTMYVERFGGDANLAARAVFYSTLAALVTVPAFSILFQWLIG
jgi:predicted permease